MTNSGYDFYLGKCLLPVPPSKLSIKINNANKTVTLINEGEVNVLKKAELSDIEFECAIPQVRYPYAVYKSGFRGADFFLDCFEELKAGRQPFQFIVCRRGTCRSRLLNEENRCKRNYTTPEVQTPLQVERLGPPGERQPPARQGRRGRRTPGEGRVHPHRWLHRGGWIEIF